MARMIPTFIDDDAPPGEKAVFDSLAAAPEDWVVLHSLDLSPWNHNKRTEIDFVVMMPDAGILCIEVKSQENLGIEEGMWQPPEIKRSPFKQAADGRYTLFRSIKEIAPRLSWIPILHCCIFPRANFLLPQNLSIQPWELLDARDFRSYENASEFCAALRERLASGIEADAMIPRLKRSFVKNELDHLLKICVPAYKRHPDKREEISKREEQLMGILRAQQKPIVHLAQSNKSILVTGGAGTGKTLIAMELARRKAAQGLRVGFFCYNHIIGNWLKDKLAQDDPCFPNLVVGRAIQTLAYMAEIDIPDLPSQDFWEATLPEMIEEKLESPDFKAEALFDYLVLDEAQDIIARPKIWHCLCQFLSGGVEQGSFAIFGDFKNQVLADRGNIEKTLADLESAAHPAHWNLDENCRNYRIVGETAVRLGGLKSNEYSGYLRASGDKSNLEIFFYESEEMQLDQIELWLDEFKEKGYKESEITLLSFRADAKSAAAKLEDRGLKLHSARQAGDSISFASIHAFKGMENKIILITDVSLEGRDFQRDLLYVGITRATESVRILCTMASKKDIPNDLLHKTYGHL